MMKREERILLTSSAMWNMSQGMLGPLFAVFAERIGGNILDITWAWASYLAVTGVAIMLVGRFVDGGGRRTKQYVMLVGYTLTTLFTFAYLLVDSSLELMLVQMGLGLALALAAPTWLALYSEYEDKKHDGFAWGITSGADRLSMAAGILAGGYIVAWYSFEALFVTMGCVQALATLYQTRILSRTRT